MKKLWEFLKVNVLVLLYFFFAFFFFVLEDIMIEIYVLKRFLRGEEYHYNEVNL